MGMSRSEAQKAADKAYQDRGGSPSSALKLMLDPERRAKLEALQRPGESQQQAVYRLIDAAAASDG
jgi:hypothetical protein